MHYFVINTKNYLEASGVKLDKLVALLARAKVQGRRLRIFIAVPAFDLRYLHVKYPNVDFLTQHLDAASAGSSTGALVPEIAKASGACGSIINHSERRLEEVSITKLVNRLRDLKMISIVCARDVEEVSRLSACKPDFIAVEPPELIGTGKAVSSVSPRIISDSRAALNGSNVPDMKTKLLCGAGIVDAEDAIRAIELGAEGILVASGVVLSRDWKTKIDEFCKALSG